MIFFISFLTIQLFDYDFWWHLATGKYIVENQSLPQDDPFLYTSHDTDSKRKTIILKGYWLAQVIFYKLFVLWDIKGIIILRSLLLVLFLFFIFLTVRKQNVSCLLALMITAGCFLTAKHYAGERPVLFTFLTFSVVFYLLEDFRVNRSKKVFIIPVLVMALSNMHPGYVVCIMLITLYLVGEGIRYFFSKDYKDSIFKDILMIWILTVIFSMLNPNGATMLTRLFSIHGVHTKGIMEFMPTFFLYKNKLMQINYAYITFLLFSLLSLRYLRKIGLTHMLLLAVFTLMSFVAGRYVIFYMCVSAPILARIIVNLKEERVFTRLVAVLKAKEGFLVLIAGVIGVFLFFNALTSFARFEFKENVFFAVPKGAADFLSNVEIKGNMFNEYGFGGYLMWRLYPDKKVFIDTRQLEYDVYIEYQTVVDLTKGLPQSWEDIIEKYNITYIVIPPLMNRGEIHAVVEQLFDSEDWVLIYMDHLSFIFLRNDSQNTAIIKRFAIDKRQGLNTIVIQASARAMKNRANPYYLISIGKVFFKMGKLDAAEKAFLMAYQRDPDNQELKFWMQKFEENKTDVVKDK